MPKQQRLYCQTGEHYWERPSQRGKPPRNCKEHAPAPKQASPRRAEPKAQA